MNVTITETGGQLLRFCLGSATLLAIKAAVTEMLAAPLGPYSAYACVHVLVFFLSYLLHGRFTFRGQGRPPRFWQFTRAVLALKVADYLAFVLLVSGTGWQAWWCVLLVSGVIFAIRFVVLRAVFHRGA